MDCEKFDKVSMDWLYGELDALAKAAAERHVEHCARCSAIDARLRAGRELGLLCLGDAPQGLSERIVRAERGVHSQLGLRQRFGRTISILAGYAMRPQLAMGSLLLLMIGSSLLFLRVGPLEAEHGAVTERGVPESDHDLPRSVPLSEPAPALSHAVKNVEAAAVASKDGSPVPTLSASSDERAAAPADNDYDTALEAFRAGRFLEAQRLFDAIAGQRGPKSARAALFGARAVRGAGGCRRATAHFDAVANRFAGSASASDASWEAAECYAELGKAAQAKQRYLALAKIAPYETRARQALEQLQGIVTRPTATSTDSDDLSDDAGVAAAPPAPSTEPLTADAGSPPP